MRVIILAVVLSFLASCGTRKKPIARDLRIAIDTTTSKVIKELRPQLDSLCDARFDSLVQVAVDSIMEVRKLEIEEIVKQ